jgi:hypothetical protein
VNNLVAIVEALNQTLKERYVAATVLSADQFSRLIVESAPPSIAHWGAADRVAIKFLHYALAPQESSAFISRYLGNTPLPGWKDVVEEQV